MGNNGNRQGYYYLYQPPWLVSPPTTVTKNAFQNQISLAGGDTAQERATKNTYDILGRIIKVEKNFNNAGYKVISALEYDALGQLKKKSIGTNPLNTSLPLETLAYDYNIRGWLLGENRDYAKTAASTTNYFGFDLGYDKNTIAPSTGGSIGTYVTPAYNGNIEGMVWKSKGDGEIRKYDFNYDAVNRLMKADFNQYTSGAFNKTANVDFSVKIGDGVSATSAYDANGNIKRMQQWGLKIGSSSQIDDLTYNYMNTGYSNKLLNVADAFNDNQTALGDFRVSALNPVQTKTTTTVDYTYDANGNLVIDLNKDLITSAGANGIQYNYLNLPTIITVKKDATSNKGTITYTYDAGGNKQKKVTVDNSITGKTITNTTTYINGFVYESKITVPIDAANPDYTDVLQFTPHEEGRIRRKTDGTFAYDYFLKDHLGNVRMVLTDEVSTNYYPAATLEGTYDASTNSMVNTEKLFYKIDNTKIIAETSILSWGTETTANTKLYYNHNGNPPPNLSYPASCSPLQTDGSNKLYKLNATSNRTGLEFVIKVMAGDKIDIFGKSYYLNTTNITNTNSTPLDVLSLMTNFLLAPVNPAAGKGFTASVLNTINNGVIPSTFFRGNNSEPTTQIPKAYINYIFLDEQFKYAGGNASRVGTSGTVKDHWYVDAAALQNITVPKNGYIFVYVSNESNFDVFFDNLQVIHKPGPILEETHYYPFGLRMNGISSSSLPNNTPNKNLFNGKELQSKEFSDGSGLEEYDFNARMYDPQIGRFMSVDPHADNYYELSPYNFVNNNPLIYIDPTGKDYSIYFEKDKDGNWTVRITATYYVKKGDQDSKDAADASTKF